MVMVRVEGLAGGCRAASPAGRARCLPSSKASSWRFFLRASQRGTKVPRPALAISAAANKGSIGSAAKGKTNYGGIGSESVHLREEPTLTGGFCLSIGLTENCRMPSRSDSEEENQKNVLSAYSFTNVLSSATPPAPARAGPSAAGAAVFLLVVSAAAVVLSRTGLAARLANVAAVRLLLERAAPFLAAACAVWEGPRLAPLRAALAKIVAAVQGVTQSDTAAALGSRAATLGSEVDKGLKPLARSVSLTAERVQGWAADTAESLPVPDFPGLGLGKRRELQEELERVTERLQQQEASMAAIRTDAKMSRVELERAKQNMRRAELAARERLRSGDQALVQTRSERDEAERAAMQAQATLMELEARLAAKEGELAASQAAAQDLVAGGQGAEQLTRDLERRLTEQSARYSQLQAALATAQSSADKYGDEIDRLEAQVKEAQDSALEAAADPAEKERAESLGRELAALRESSFASATEVAAVRSQLEEAKEQLQAEAARAEELEASLQSALVIKGREAGRAANLEGELSILMSKLARSERDAGEQTSELRAAVEELEGAKGRAEGDAQAARVEVARLQDEGAEMRGRLVAADAAVEAMKAQVSATAEQMARQERALADKVAAQAAQLEEATAKVQAAAEIRAAAQRQAAAVAKREAALDLFAGALNERQDQLDADYGLLEDALARTNEAAELELEAVQRQLEAATSALAAASGGGPETAALAPRVSELQMELQAAEEAYLAKEAEVEEISQELAAVKASALEEVLTLQREMQGQVSPSSPGGIHLDLIAAPPK